MAKKSKKGSIQTKQVKRVDRGWVVEGFGGLEGWRGSEFCWRDGSVIFRKCRGGVAGYWQHKTALEVV